MNDESKGTDRAEKSVIPAVRPFRVLVVDDDKEGSSAIARALEHLGHVAVCSPDAQDALAQIGADRFDLLLVDYRMPNMTGLDLLALLREEGCKIPAIMMTGYYATEDRVPQEQLGICAILRKPLSLPVLERALEEPLMAARG